MDVFALFDSISILVVGVSWQWSSEARILNPVMGIPIVSGGELRYHAKLSPSIHILTLNHSVMSNARVVLPVASDRTNVCTILRDFTSSRESNPEGSTHEADPSRQCGISLQQGHLGSFGSFRGHRGICKHPWTEHGAART